MQILEWSFKHFLNRFYGCFKETLWGFSKKFWGDRSNFRIEYEEIKGNSKKFPPLSPLKKFLEIYGWSRKVHSTRKWMEFLYFVKWGSLGEGGRAQFSNISLFHVCNRNSCVLCTDAEIVFKLVPLIVVRLQFIFK